MSTNPADPAPDPERREAGPRARPRRAEVRDLLDALQRKAPEQPKLLVNSISMKLVLIPAGVFRMGSPEAEQGRRTNEGPVREVAITAPFYLGAGPVTQGQYEQIMKSNPSRFHAGAGGGADLPVESVSWDDAVRFCRVLSELPEEKQAGRVYRLPTEAEWEFACRAGSEAPFSYGASLGADAANFDASRPAPPEAPTASGAFPASHFGLCDMHGNVWEWCADWYAAGYYRSGPRNDPKGPETGQFRVVRGGSWRNHAATCRAAYRNAYLPGNRDAATGFRVAAVMVEDLRGRLAGGGRDAGANFLAAQSDGRVK
jgi:formylglycine-generating enzyme